METLSFTLSGNNALDMQMLGAYIERHIAEHWQSLLQKHEAKLIDAYNRAGDMAYGTYLNLLFRQIHTQLSKAGLQLKPKLPGDFDISREWGNADESDQQRWMWSTLYVKQGAPLGTIVTITFHDHRQFRLPRAPQIIALTATDKAAVIEALSQRSADFAQALEFTVEYAAYLRSQTDAAPQQ